MYRQRPRRCSRFIPEIARCQSCSQRACVTRCYGRHRPRLQAGSAHRHEARPAGGAASPECGPPPTPRPGHEPLSHCAGACGEGESRAVTMQIRPWSDVQVSLT